jgi:hypothetical protein
MGWAAIWVLGLPQAYYCWGWLLLLSVDSQVTKLKKARLEPACVVKRRPVSVQTRQAGGWACSCCCRPRRAAPVPTASQAQASRRGAGPAHATML